ncbi:Lipase-GDSL domain-containing protein [Mycena indigotica]|uniref:Lipase-GDSL domain-containing protein n=1 Tax=Mycena indigotica TaxID=2126181 RepID=A0A8H6W6P4_9AGAR|nr:Lipase-GDSL domain-containing protein [Mycena indigotica]KAF7303633.1 Lipase-GDSL domain-containing protein [Mycena indigotica]
MIAVTISFFYSSVLARRETRTIEPIAKSIHLWTTDQPWPSLDSFDVTCEVKITLIDWASVLEIDGLELPNDCHIYKPSTRATTNMLFIGDSISSGFSLEDATSPALPLGILDAYPYQTANSLSNNGMDVEVEVVAYPGITLCGGMSDKFFCRSVWDATPFKPSLSVIDFKYVFIALGTNDVVSASEFSKTLLKFIKELLTTPQMKETETVYILHPFIDFTEPLDSLNIENLPLHISYESKPRKDIRIVTVPQSRICQDLNYEHTLDGLHPTVDGHKLIGGNLAKFVFEDLRVPDNLNS